MDLRETSPVPAAALPLAEFRAHLRLGSGFSDEVTPDATLEQYLRAALASVEGRVARALFRRDYLLVLTRWREDYAQRLPVAPVVAVASVTLVNAGGVEMVVSPTRYRLDGDGTRPRLEAAGTALPMIPTGGRVEIGFTAGFGPAWEDIPADLRQAVLLLAAQYYEGRDGTGDSDAAFGIRSLLERWRDLRMGGGA
ncbi:head-tail connector protein [Natronohydrobacter thiooxidans]|uniref:head-tail connector protein n=1 Tax=Natronohydrobacter thiooxidans TaxID=87172 RepID=UPI0008FF4BA1|nr:hypothetical protein [Natronohydrobacter thiooxidans]